MLCDVEWLSHRQTEVHTKQIWAVDKHNKEQGECDVWLLAVVLPNIKHFFLYYSIIMDVMSQRPQPVWMPDPDTIASRVG